MIHKLFNSELITWEDFVLLLGEFSMNNSITVS